MSNCTEASEKLLKSLIPNIEEMLEDSELQEFHPVLKQMLAGCETFDFDNISDVIEAFTKADSAFVCRKLSEAACEHASFSHTRRWYD